MSGASPSLATVREAFNNLAPPGTPVTTAEIAEEFDCTSRTIYNKLDALVDDGVLKTKKVGARGRVWWRPPQERGRGPDDRLSNREMPANSTSDDEGECRTEAARRQLAEERDMFADGPAVVFRWSPEPEEGWPVEYVTKNVENVFGYTPEELESGEVPYSDLLLDEELDRIAREVAENTESMAERFSHEPYRVTTKEGDIKWVKDTTKIVRDDSGQVVNYLGYLIDVTERKRKEEELKRANDALKRLNTANRELIDADADTFSHRAAEVTGTVLDVEYVTLWRYDRASGELLEDTVYDDSETDCEGIPCSDDTTDPVWQTFLTNEVTVEDDFTVEATATESDLRSYILVPLGRHGVICAGSTVAEQFDQQTVDLAKTLAATIEAAWDRAEGQQRLADRNEQLQHLDRLNSLIREIDQALVKADSIDAIDEAVCEQLADAEQYEFAWIGELDFSTGTITPREWAGVDNGYLETLPNETKDSGVEQDPIAAALQTQELQVVADIAIDPRAAAWREATLERGARSCIAIPLVYNESLYGVLTVYADHPLPDEQDHSILTELGETIAHAIDAAETKRTLLTDNVTELTLEIRKSDNILATLAQNAGGEIEFDGLVPHHDDETRLFFTARDVAPEGVLAAAREHPAIAGIAVLRDDSARCIFEANVTEPTIASRIVNNQGLIRSLTATADVTTAVVDLPATATVREFVEHLQAVYPSTELVMRQTCDRSITTRQDLRDSLFEQLTDRQREILEIAYRSGFFESPRVRTGQELSEMLDITQSTFSYHLRAGERRLLKLVFESS